MARSVVVPLACICRTTGSTLAAKASAAARFAVAPLACASPRLVSVAQRGALRLLCRQGGAGAVRDQGALFLGQRRIDMEHEGVRVRPKRGHYERHPLGHQPRGLIRGRMRRKAPQSAESGSVP